MLLSEHVYCVVIPFKMTEQVEQWIFITFCVKLEHSFVETIQMIQKATAMGSWWLAASSQQCAHSCINLVQSIWWNIKPPSWLSIPYSPDLMPCDFWLFQNWNHLWKGIDFKPLMRFRKIWQSSWWRLGELCEVPKCYSEGDWGIIVLCTMFLVSCIFFNKCFYFSYFMAGYLLDRPHTVVNILMSLNFFIYMSIYLKMNLYLLKYLVDV